MFREVGKELKGLAKSIVIRNTILYVIMGIAIVGFSSLIPEGIGIGVLIAVLVIIIGYLSARMKAIELFAYGELVDCVSMMKKQFCDEVKSANPVPVVKVDPAKQWLCSCGHANALARSHCSRCGLEKIYRQ